PVVHGDNDQAKVSWNGARDASYYLNADPEGESSEIWAPNNSNGNLTFAAIKKTDKGQEAYLANGIIATNRFIDRQQNAYVLLDMVKRVAPARGGRIVFAEATFGNAHIPGVFESIGTWALAGWFQLLFLGVVVVYSLGKPFGYPDPERRQERGARELM